MLKSRELQLINCVNDRQWISDNKTIMDYAARYIEEKELRYKTLGAINQVRICKKMILPCELTGFYRNKVMKKARELLEKNLII